jgi:hypothetical protein
VKKRRADNFGRQADKTESDERASALACSTSHSTTTKPQQFHEASIAIQLQLVMKLLFRVAHTLLVLVLSSLLIYSVYYAFALLGKEQQHSSQQPVPDHKGGAHDDVSRKPSPQEIVCFSSSLGGAIIQILTICRLRP